MIKRKQWAAVACTLATAALAACGGDGDQTQAAQTGGTSTAGNGSNGGAVTQPAALTPLAGGSLYVGAVSFGDTVSVALDQPAAGQVTLRFLDSRFGLGGTLVGSYTLSGDTYKVTKLAAASADVPAALATAATDGGGVDPVGHDPAQADLPLDALPRIGRVGLGGVQPPLGEGEVVREG